ncbi:MAG TPA: hypothetical protein VFY87_02160, partial [Geminicoccaceae bacterium]|nr:hypothetical protein [Geminicoccaceae bacterium]
MGRRKEQQDDAELGDAGDAAGLGEEAEGEGPDRDACRDVAEHRAEADALRQRHRDHGGGEQDDGLQQRGRVGGFGHGGLRCVTNSATRHAASATRHAAR